MKLEKAKVNKMKKVKQNVKQNVKQSYVRTPAFQAGDRDSNSLGGTNYPKKLIR